MNLPSHADFYGIASIVLFVFAAIVAPELLCRDRRDGVIHLYLVRPLTGSRLRRLALGRVPRRHRRGGVAAAADPADRAGAWAIPRRRVPAQQLARHPALPARRRGHGGVCDDARAADRIIHDATRVRVGVPRRPVHHHDAVHGGLAGDRRRRPDSGSRCST
jgi:hypothetical protein